MIRRAQLLILLLVLFAPLSAQKKYLVTPDREIVPLKPGDDITGIISSMIQRDTQRVSEECLPPSFGYPQWVYWTDGMLNVRPLDVIAQWFVTPAAGTIDSIYWVNGAISTAILDSTAFLRVHRSTIGPGYGPGVRPGPFSPPCQPWGYYISTNDPESGIMAFPYGATDTAWVSTYPGSSVPTMSPIGEALWGEDGYPVKLKANSVNFAAMADLAPLHVDVGDRLFISIGFGIIPHDPVPPEGTEEIPTQFAFTAQSSHDPGGEYPSRDWKFYHQPGHTGNGPSNCSSYDPDSLPAGWFARGGLSSDSTDVLALNLWYTMTITGDAPPIVGGWNIPRNTFSTEDQQVAALIWDCYSVIPGNTEIESAFMRYTVDGEEHPPIPMSKTSGDVWLGTIPGQPAGSLVYYNISGVDLDGDTGVGPPLNYRVLEFGNEWYALDTGYACAPNDIRATGTTLDPSGFFLPPGAPPGALPGEDGTSGPVDMGNDFYLFGDRFRYAWIGVNGGIALTDSPTDTQDVNPGGIWQAMNLWDFPNDQKEGRPDTVNPLAMPGMFIAPLWANHVLENSTSTYGRIVTGNDSDTCLFIVEWDSIGNYETDPPTMNGTTFRLVLDRCGGAVEFQYGDVYGLINQQYKLSGMQADSNALSGPDPGYVMLSKFGSPEETAPVNGRCIRMVPTVGFMAQEEWNLVAVSAAPLDGDYHKSSLFPGSGPAWRYHVEGYASSIDPIMSPGEGYWMKVAKNGRVGKKAGTFISELFVPVHDKWNMVGGLSGFIYVGDIIPIPSGPPYSLSDFFGYGEEGYYTTLFLEPGKAYWVNAGIGQFESLWMTSSAAVPKTDRVSTSLPDLSAVNSIVVRDARGRSQTLYLDAADPVGASPRSIDLPPPPPGRVFDARFTSGRMVETYPVSAVENRDYDFPVVIRDALYPVTLTWNFPDSPVGRRWVLWAPSNAPGPRQPIEGSGSTVIRDPSIGAIVLSLSANSDLPAAYAFNRNFPNPFNPSTTFTIDLPEPADVRVEVVDILGRSIATLLDEWKPAGTHSLSWDGRDRAGTLVPTGVYVVRMSAAGFTATMKVLLMK